MKKINLQHFAQVIDLTEKLSEEKDKILVKGDVYEVNAGFKTMIEVDSIMKNKKGLSQIEQLAAFFTTLFGEEKANELMDKNYKISFYKEVLAAALSVIKGDDDEKK